jgi:hypothetical protein
MAMLVMIILIWQIACLHVRSRVFGACLSYSSLPRSLAVDVTHLSCLLHFLLSCYSTLA